MSTDYNSTQEMDEISMDTSRTSCHGDELFANRSPDSEVFVISHRGRKNGKYQNVNNQVLLNLALVHVYHFLRCSSLCDGRLRKLLFGEFKDV